MLLGGGPWGSAGTRDLPTLPEEVELTRARLREGTPVIGFGLGAQILAIAAGGSAETGDLIFEIETVTRTCDDALNGYLPETFTQVAYMRDRPVPPAMRKILAEDSAGRPAVFRIGANAYGFVGNPGIKLGMVEDLIMEFEEVPGQYGRGARSTSGPAAGNRGCAGADHDRAGPMYVADVVAKGG